MEKKLKKKKLKKRMMTTTMITSTPSSAKKPKLTRLSVSVTAVSCFTIIKKVFSFTSAISRTKRSVWRANSAPSIKNLVRLRSKSKTSKKKRWPS